MKKGIMLLIVLAVSLLLLMSTVQTVSAGVEPSPFVSEINQLHSIELNVAAIDNRIGKLPDSPRSPKGVTNYLEEMAKKLGDLDTRLEDVLVVLPMPMYDDPYDGQEDVLSSLEGMKSDASSIYDVAERMGVEPTPFREAALSVQDNAQHIMNRIDGYAGPIGDYDKDGIMDVADNCPGVFNPEQEDTNGDDIGDLCTLAIFPAGGGSAAYYGIPPDDPGIPACRLGFGSTPYSGSPLMNDYYVFDETDINSEGGILFAGASDSAFAYVKSLLINSLPSENQWWFRTNPHKKGEGVMGSGGQGITLNGNIVVDERLKYLGLKYPEFIIDYYYIDSLIYGWECKPADPNATITVFIGY